MPRKRANGEGSIYKRKSDNRWTGKLQVGFKQDGTPKYKVVYGDTQKEVKNKIEELKGNIKSNTFVESNKITFGEWLDIWLNVTMKNTVKDTTWLIYELMIRRHIKPELGGIKLMQLKPSHIQKLYNDKLIGGRCDGKQGGLSPKSIKHMHQTILGALKQALKEKLVSENVAYAANPPKVINKEMKTLDIDQIGKFLETAKTNYRYKRYYPMYLLEIFTGLRRGEILGIRGKDIDFEKNTVTVVQQLVKAGSRIYLRELKTESSQNRIIIVPEQVIKVLKEHYENKIEEYKKLGYTEEKINDIIVEGLLFTNELGDRIQPRNFIRNFKGLLKTAGISTTIRFHDTRHTFSLLSLQQGVDIKTLQSDLGHGDISTTLNRYGHVNEKMKQDAAAKRSEFIKLDNSEE